MQKISETSYVIIVLSGFRKVGKMVKMIILLRIVIIIF